ncbi:hypothetical protein H6P81_020273 [Aristolochia fimbriata]|uniref:Legume lectin domain-containing protein n=1 Tax=Aristolochia fimbriata TaxID=158543 RepID=A0AAV7DU37_ARIFI|nr:hypothetical protein H6P81_020273 [Aristolochia fimbriata]
MSTSSFSCLLLRTLMTFFFLVPFTSSISFRFPSFDPNSTTLFYEGDASVFNGAIQMNDYEYFARNGRITYSHRVPIWDSATQRLTRLTDFTTHFVFSITTLGNPIYGHGLVFYRAAPDFDTPQNSNGGFLGMFNTTTLGTPSRNQIVTVEFDTYVNTPWDPPVPHTGICVNTLASVKYLPWNISLHNGFKANAWVDYSSS